MLQMTSSRVGYEIGKIARAHSRGKPQPGSARGTSACLLVRMQRAERSCSGVCKVPLGSRLSSQAMRWIGRCRRNEGAGTVNPSLVSVIDDDPWSREGISCYLESCGYTCTAFCTAEEFLSADAAGETVCLVSDVHLPGITGPELQDRLLADGYRVPIIFVTGYFDEGMRDRVLRAGAIAYLAKPWCEKTLSTCIEKAFGVVAT